MSVSTEQKTEIIPILLQKELLLGDNFLNAPKTLAWLRLPITNSENISGKQIRKTKKR